MVVYNLFIFSDASEDPVERSTTTRVTYWISYAQRVTVWGFQFGRLDHVFMVPIFGGTVSGYHARSSTIKSVLSFTLSTNLSSTRYEISRWYITVPSTWIKRATLTLAFTRDPWTPDFVNSNRWRTWKRDQGRPLHFLFRESVTKVDRLIFLWSYGEEHFTGLSCQT